MNTYGIVTKDGETGIIQANHYSLDGGMATFYRVKECGKAAIDYAVKSINVDSIEHITLQQEFTEEEQLKQIKEG